MSRIPAYDTPLPVDPDDGSPGDAVVDAHDVALDRGWSGTERRALLAIVAILAVDMAFVLVNIAFGESADFPERLKVTRYFGVPEVFAYLQWLLAAGVLWRLRSHGALYVLWALVLLYRFFGDVFEFHHFLERLLNPGALRLFEPFGTAAAIKEVLGHVVDESVLMILVLLALVAIRRRRRDPVATRYSRRAIVLQMLYVVFLVLGEWLFLFVIDDRRVAGILEEGGEMAAASLIFGLTLLHAARLSGKREGQTADARSRGPSPGT